MLKDCKMGISLAGKAIIAAWIFCLVLTEVSAACSVEGPLPASSYLTAWYNSDDRSDGQDIENIASVREVDPNVCETPTSVECRVRIAHLNTTEAGQVLESNCTNTTLGLVCHDSQQVEACYDYEIRFTCPPAADALPAPNLHWELNGRTSASDNAPEGCSGRPKFYNTTIYSNTPDVTDGMVNPNNHSTLILQDGPSSSRYTCALRSARTGQANLGWFLDQCVFDVSCCARPKGKTVSVWMNDHSKTDTNMAIIALQARGKQGISFEKRSQIQYAFPARYDDRKNFGEVQGDPLTPYGVWAHYILASNYGNSMVFVDGVKVLDQVPYSAATTGLSVLPLLLFAEEPDVNNLEESPDVSLSNLKIFYKKFDESEALKLYLEEIGTLSASSEDNVHILYVHRVSEISDPNLLVECVARGPGKNMEPSINWFILAADGINYSQLNQSGLNHRVYTASVSDNHRTMSALQLINYDGNSSIVCEAIDSTTGARKASELKLSERSYNWTGWISLDAPHLQESDNGNDRFILIKEETCERPIDIECRTRYTHVPSDATGQVFDVNCTIEGGLLCSGFSQGFADNFTCLNAFEVRLLCPQQPIYWTRWFNEGYGSAGSSDDEKFSIHKGLNDPTLCDSPLFAQCRFRVADTTTSWESMGVQLEYPYACTPEGLSCLHSDNVGGCQDFEVRYACPYPSVASPKEYWDLSGRLTLDGSVSTDCGSHSNNVIYSNTGRASVSPSFQIQYTEAPEQLSQKCAVQTTSAGITLGNFDGKCLSKIGWCKNGMTVSVWIKQHTSATGSDMVFFTSGGDESHSNGFAFVQKSSDKDYYVHFRSDGLHWNDIVLPEADITIGKWFHVTLTFKDAIEGKLYIDGSLKGSTTEFTIELNSRDEKDDFIIGSSQSSSNTANAAFSDVKFFDFVLTDEAVNGLFFCDETVTDPEVLSLTVESHHLNPELTIKCEVRGYPLTGVKWFLTSNITTPAVIFPLEQSGPSAVITDERTGCVLTSRLIAHDFATNFPVENVTFICSGEFNHNKDFTNVFVEVPNECERDVGFESGKIRPVQISSNLVLVFVAVPSLNGGSPWVSTADDQSAYIEFDFGLRHKFAGLVVQGTPSSFISTYKVFYGDSPSGSLTVHSNLNGGSESVWNSFNPEIESRIIRLRSLDTDGADQARVEFYGCPIEDPVLNLTKLISSYDPATNIYTLHCEGSYFPPPEVTWLADGQVISESRYDNGKTAEGVLTLIKELKLTDFEVSDDEVVFTCVVAAEGANITQNIQTEYAFTGQISVENTTEIVYLQSVSFVCTATGDDVYTMDWYFTSTTHTTPILLGTGNGVTAEGFTVGDSTGVFTLTVQSYGEDRDGTYQCSVNRATKQGNITTNADILLIVTIADPVYHQSNSSYTLTCTVIHYGGYPSVVEWALPNGTVISGSDLDGLYQVSETAGETANVSELIVQGEYQNGTYTCTGRTAKEAWSDAVYVAEGESFEITSLSGNYNFTLLSYTAECVASFVISQPEVTWVTPDGGEITSGDSHVIEHVSNGYLSNVLTISSTDFSKYDGNYTCKVSSGDFMVEDDILLRYAYGGELTLNVTQRFELGEDVKLTCTASEGDSVDEFTWSKVIDGSTSMPVVQDDIFKLSEVTRQSSRSSYLEIAMFSRIDEGNYECSVNSGSKKIDLTVSALPELVMDFQYLSTITEMLGVTHADLLHVTKSVLTNQKTSSLSNEELSIVIAAMERLSSVAPNLRTLPVSEGVQELLGINKLLEQFLNGQTLEVVMEFTVFSEKITTMYAQQFDQNASVSTDGMVILVENIDRASPINWFTIGGEGDIQRTAASLQDDLFSDASASIHCDIENVQDIEGSLSVAVVYNEMVTDAVDDDAFDIEVTDLGTNANATAIEQSLISGVLSFTLTDRVKKHSVPVTFTLRHEQDLDDDEQTIVVNGKTRKRKTRAKCVFWREARRVWSDAGCSLLPNSSSSGRSSCRCAHTTSFAILMQVVEYEIPAVHKTALKWLTYVGCSISIVALVLTIFTFTYLGSLQSDRTFIHKNLVVALMISDLLFIAGVGETKIKIACKVIAILLHFFYLSVFSWMLTEGLHLYNMVVRVFGSETSRWKVYSLLGWGIPVLVVGITTAIDHDGYGSDGGCWLIVERGFIWAFVGPAVGIIAVNMAVMCMVIKIIIQSTNVKAGSSKEQAKAGVKGAIFLLPLLGLTWAFGLMAINSDTVIFQYLFTIFNSLQGFFVFFFHCLMNSEVRQAWRLKRKQIMLSRGEFTDSNAISAHLGLNATGSSGQCDLNCVDYVIDPEDIRTSNLSTTQGSSPHDKEKSSRSNVQDIKVTGASDPSRGPVTRPRKRRPQPVLRCETPIEESIPGAILEDTDVMEEVRVTHRIIENDDWTVEEKRHVTRKMMKKKPSPNQSELRDGVSHVNDASADYTGPAQPAYGSRKCPQYSAAQAQSDVGRGALVRTPPTNDNKNEPSNGSIDLAIKNALFNGGGYPQYSKENGKGKLPVAKGANSRVDLPDLPGSSRMEHPSPTSSNIEENSDDGADF